MGLISFQIPPGLRQTEWRDLERASIAGGPDLVPWPTRTRVEQQRLLLERDTGESGTVLIPWHVAGAGLVMTATGTLMERPLPYHLQLELARGKINQLRCQLADWQTGGLNIPPSVEDQVRAASRSFACGATSGQDDCMASSAQTALELAFAAGDALTVHYIERALVERVRDRAARPFRLGVDLYREPDQSTASLLQTFAKTAGILLPWNEIEATEGDYCWDRADQLLAALEPLGLDLVMGPIIEFSAAALPAWLWRYERDLNLLGRAMANFVTAALRRYGRRIRNWRLTRGSNYSRLLSLGEEELHWLTIKLAQLARQIDPTIELSVGVAQPWGEYMATSARTHSPFAFADSILRYDLNLTGLEIEIAMGYAPRGSYCRELLEVNRLLNTYAILGAPVQLTLAFPSSVAPDPLSDPELCVDAGYCGQPPGPESQADWAEKLAALAACKSFIHSVRWAHLSDSEPHQFPHAGLVGSKGEVKPALQRLALLGQRMADLG